MCLVGLLALAGCSKHPATEPQASASGSAAASFVPAASSASAAPAVASDPPPLPAGCFDSLTAETPESLLDQLGARCAGGMQPNWQRPQLLKLDGASSRSAELRVTDPSRCLRAAAVGPAAAKLEFTLVAPDGSLLSSGSLGTRLGLLNPGGPICVESAGAYQLVVKLDIAGEVALQAWFPAATTAATNDSPTEPL